LITHAKILAWRTLRSAYFSAILSQILVIFLGLATSILTARSLSPDDRGHLGLMLLIPTVGGALLHCGMPQAIPTLMLKGLRRETLIVSGLTTAAITAICGSIITLLASLAVAQFYDPSRIMDYAVIGAAAGGLIFLPFGIAILTADKKFGLINFQRIGSASFQLIGLIIVIAAGIASALSIAILSCAIPIFFSIIIFAFYKIQFKKNPTRKKYSRIIFKYGITIFQSYISIFIISTMDRLLAPTLMTPAEVGYYFICVGCVAPLIAISDSARNILLMSYSSSPASSDGRSRHIYSIALSFMLFAATSLAIWIFGADIITLLFGASYRPAGDFIAYVGASVAAQALSRYASVVLETENRARISAITNFLGIILLMACAAGAIWMNSTLLFLAGLAATHTAVALAICAFAVAVKPATRAQ
jgi:O-antigen/teichoic acid export membrane protein